MSLNKIFWIQLLLSLIIGQQQAGTAWGEVRTWVDATGKFSVTAELFEVRGDKVVLQKQNGKQITVPVVKLSAKDQKFLNLVEHTAQAEAELEKGRLFFEKQDWDTAIACFTEAIRLNPSYAETYFSRGLACNVKGDYDKSIADYTQAYVNRGYVYHETRDFDKSIANYTQAIRLNPNDAKANFSRAV